MPYQPKLRKGEFNVDGFLTEVATFMPLSYKVLCFNKDESDGNLNFFEIGKSNAYFRNMCHVVALGGLLPATLETAYGSGNLYHWAENTYEWAENLFPGIDVETCPEKAIVIIKPNYSNGGFNNTTKAHMENLAQEEVSFFTYDQIYTDKVLEADVTEETVTNYLQNVGDKFKDGWWEVTLHKIMTIEVQYKDGKWSYREGLTELIVRNFHSINHKSVINPHKILLLVLNYLISSHNRNVFKDHRAFLSGVFVEQVTLGYSHKILVEC